MEVLPNGEYIVKKYMNAGQQVGWLISCSIEKQQKLNIIFNIFSQLISEMEFSGTLRLSRVCFSKFSYHNISFSGMCA
jgi:hypothetical protein